MGERRCSADEAFALLAQIPATSAQRRGSSCSSVSSETVRLGTGHRAPERNASRPRRFRPRPAGAGTACSGPQTRSGYGPQVTTTTEMTSKTATERPGAVLLPTVRAMRGDAEYFGDLLCAGTGRLLARARTSAEVATDLLEQAAVSGLLGGGRAAGGDPTVVDLIRRDPRWCRRRAHAVERPIAGCGGTARRGPGHMRRPPAARHYVA
jgi:hypothetical protein